MGLKAQSQLWLSSVPIGFTAGIKATLDEDVTLTAQNTTSQSVANQSCRSAFRRTGDVCLKTHRSTTFQSNRQMPLCFQTAFECVRLTKGTDNLRRYCGPCSARPSIYGKGFPSLFPPLHHHLRLKETHPRHTCLTLSPESEPCKLPIFPVALTHGDTSYCSQLCQFVPQWLPA